VEVSDYKFVDTLKETKLTSQINGIGVTSNEIKRYWRT
jgi:hypothetical protein